MLGIGVGLTSLPALAKVGAIVPPTPTPYALSYEDDFSGPLDIVAPDKPLGRYPTTRAYMFPSAGQGPRGATSVLTLKMYDADPAHTGHNDANRGVARASWADSMVQSGGALTLKARRATTAEQTLFNPAMSVTEIGAMIHTANVIMATAPCAFEVQTRLPARASAAGGWHPSWWLMQMDVLRTGNEMEIDFEGESDLVEFNEFVHAGSSTKYKAGETTAIHDGNLHTLRMEVDVAERRWFIDGVQVASQSRTLTQPLKPFYFLASNHIANFASDPYVAAEWASAGTDGARMVLENLRVERKAGAVHYTPLVADAVMTAAFNTPFSFTLPSTADVWGSAVAEKIEAFMVDSNEPGGNYEGGYSGAPAGVTIDQSGAQPVISGTISDKPGTLHLVRYPLGAAGTSSRPQRLAIHVGPRWTTATINLPVGGSIDLYSLADCGQLTSANGARAKTITAAIPNGSGITLTGDTLSAANAGTYTVPLTVTNSVGQQATVNATVTVSATTYEFMSWAPMQFDATDASTVTRDGSNIVSAMANKSSGGGNLVYGGAAGQLAYSASAFGGRGGLVLTGLAATDSTRPRLSSAAASDLVSAMFQGDDKPFTVMAVYTPLDTTTGFIWGASASLSSTSSAQVGLIRRDATNGTPTSTARRQAAGQVATDVQFSSGGSPANGTRIVVIRFNGTTVDIWDTSTTKKVSAAAMNTAAIPASVFFRLFVMIGANSVYASTQGNLEFGGIFGANAAKSDAIIAQAIQDAATKFGVTLA